MSKDKENKKIEVDKNWFNLVNKTMTDLVKEIKELKKEKKQLSEIPRQEIEIKVPIGEIHHTFWAQEIFLGKEGDPDFILKKNLIETQFHAELEKLMLKYEVVEIRSSLFMPYK